MKGCWELDSERTVLECHQCRELIVLLGHEEDWYTGGHIFFECPCGQKLTITAKLPQLGE